MKLDIKSIKAGAAMIFKARLNKTAKPRLLIGPASAISIMSLFGLRRLKGSNGAGFPQPKTKDEPDKTKNNGNKIPKGSRWAKGLIVSLPLRRGVGSPSLSAAKQWANSWMVIASISSPKEIIRLNIAIQGMVSYSPSMALKCDNCGKGVTHGHFVSHAKNRMNRTFRPNLQRATIVVAGVKKKMMLCASCLRTLKKQAYA